jgi:hypothetical protein
MVLHRPFHGQVAFLSFDLNHTYRDSIDVVDIHPFMTDMNFVEDAFGDLVAVLHLHPSFHTDLVVHVNYVVSSLHPFLPCARQIDPVHLVHVHANQDCLHPYLMLKVPLHIYSYLEQHLQLHLCFSDLHNSFLLDDPIFVYQTFLKERVHFLLYFQI